MRVIQLIGIHLGRFDCTVILPPTDCPASDSDIVLGTVCIINVPVYVCVSLSVHRLSDTDRMDDVC